MPLDNRYVLAPSLQMYFVNKDTGLPLANGKVYFYKDNTSVPKDVFTIVASGSDFTYTVLPNPSTLSAVGTFQNASGVDILPYYFPFDIATGDVELYRIEVYDSLGVLQFTRVGWPNTIFDETTSAEDVTNFVPNGQFLLHTDVPASSANGFIAGKISDNQTYIAQGGWSFVKAATGSTDLVTFTRYNTPVGSPSGNPRYAVNISNTVVGTGVTRRDLCLKFPDVNTFSSTANKYNFYFEGRAVNSNNTNITLILHKYFGSGGSAETFEDITTFSLLNNEFTSFKFPILFGTNESKTLGSGEDDYVELIIRFPFGSTFTAELTDFALTVEDISLDEFPQQTEAQQIAPSTAGWLPEPSSAALDLYLPPILTKQGMTFDRSQIGQIIADGNLTKYSSSLSTITNSMLADGAQYRYNDYSSLGIPYSRLGDYYLAAGVSGVPQFGTGDNYATSYIETVNTQNLIFGLNKIGLQTAPSDSVSAPTTFTFDKIVDQTSGPIPVSPGFDFTGNTNGSTLVTCVCNSLGVSFTAVPSSATFTIAVIRNSTNTYQVFSIVGLSAAALTTGSGNPGLYFTFSNTTTQYSMWFEVNGETAAGPGTRIAVKLAAGMSAIDVARIIAETISGLQQYQVTCTAASTFSGGAYWQFTANSQLYVAYYIKGGVGADPLVANSISIPISVGSSDTNAQVASKTQVALNKFYFKVPDLRGVFLRGWDPTGIWDFYSSQRFSPSNTLLGTSPGSMQVDEIYSHRHTTSLDAADGAFVSPKKKYFTTDGVVANTNIQDSSYEGGQESRPVNMSVVWAIKY